MPKVRWVISYWICSEFYTLSSSANILKIGLRFDKVTESLKVGPFLRHSVVSNFADRTLVWSYVAEYSMILQGAIGYYWLKLLLHSEHAWVCPQCGLSAGDCLNYHILHCELCST